MFTDKFDLVELGSYLSAAAALCDSLTLADLSILAGIVTALVSSLVNLVYTYRKDRREQRESDAALARLEKER